MRKSALAMLIGATVAFPVTAFCQAEDAAFRVENAAALYMLARHPADSVRLDPAFARPGTAPGERISVLRPLRRTQRLLDTLQALRSDRPTTGTAFVSMSDPHIAADSATISITVTYPAGPDRTMLSYETLALTLRFRGGTWRVIREVQLGIS